jgi:TPR repeat protein
LYLEGKQFPPDQKKGMRLIRQASALGSSEAQYDLGIRSETGSGLPRGLEQARHFFRLCAARGSARCQYRLAKLLLALPERQERDYVQAIAWLQLAADRGGCRSTGNRDSEVSKMSMEQTGWMNKLKSQLVRPQ